jgi:hypothetical protein
MGPAAAARLRLRRRTRSSIARSVGGRGLAGARSSDEMKSRPPVSWAAALARVRTARPKAQPQSRNRPNRPVLLSFWSPRGGSARKVCYVKICSDGMSCKTCKDRWRNLADIPQIEAELARFREKNSPVGYL